MEGAVRMQQKILREQGVQRGRNKRREPTAPYLAKKSLIMHGHFATSTNCRVKTILDFFSLMSNDSETFVFKTIKVWYIQSF